METMETTEQLQRETIETTTDGRTEQLQTSLISEMNERRWEDLNADTLGNVFGRVGLESLLLDVPFVCKSWYRASLTPSCWECLLFPHIASRYLDDSENWRDVTLLERFVHEYRIDESRFSVTAFIKFVIGRSKGHATVLSLPAYTSETALKYVADVCVELKVLSLSGDLVYSKSSIISELIHKWKHLEYLILGSPYELEKILSQVSIHCKEFCGLRVSNAYIGKDVTMAIVNLVPKLKKLNLSKATFDDRDDLLMLLRGCKELVSLDVSNCVGFDEDDEEISKLASHITYFRCEGSTVYDPDDDYESHISLDDVVYDGYCSD